MHASRSLASDPPATTLLQSLLIRLIRVGLFAIPFIALLIVPSMLYTALTPKAFAFRIIVEVLSGLWLSLALFFAQYRPRRSWILPTFALFLLVMALANAQGVDPFNSFWGTLSRMDGWITLVHLFAYIVIASSMLTTERLWLSLFRLSLGISVLVSAYGILELLNLTPLHRPNHDWRQTRMVGTFQDEFSLSVYMLFHIFIAALLWATASKNHINQKTRYTVRLAYGAVIFIDTFALFASGTRGVVLGLAVGIMVTSALLAIISTSSRIRFTAIGVIVSLLMCATALAMHTPLQNGPSLSRLASLSVSDADVASRYYIYTTGWHGFLERPFMGWGQENYGIVFGRYYDPNINSRQWADRAHDIVLEMLVAGGLVGLLSYLAIFLATLWSIWREPGFSALEQCILTGLLAAYMFQNLFEFDNISSYILLGTVLAYIIWRTNAPHPSHTLFSKHTLQVRILPIVAIPIVAITLVIAWHINANAIRASIAVRQIEIAPPTNPLETFEYLQKTIGYGTFVKMEARNQLESFAVAAALNNTIDVDLKRQIFTYTQQQLQEQVNDDPLDATSYGALGELDSLYGDYPDAAVAMGRAHTLSPRHPWFLIDMAKNELARGDVATALQYLKSALELRPETVDVRVEYATAAIAISNYDLADQLLAPIVDNGTAADPRIIRAYMMRNRAEKIIAITTPYVKVHPADQWAYCVLAAAYYSEGNDAATVDMLLEAKKVAATNSSDLDNLIKNIQTNSAPRSDIMKTILTLVGF
jgi:O-antigen ligase/tetratricopeptide (TPR) repeat protein